MAATAELIECATLVRDLDSPDMTADAKLRFFRTVLSAHSLPSLNASGAVPAAFQAKRTYGRTALILSGGAAFGYYHVSRPVLNGGASHAARPFRVQIGVIKVLRLDCVRGAEQLLAGVVRSQMPPEGHLRHKRGCFDSIPCQVCARTTDTVNIDFVAYAMKSNCPSYSTRPSTGSSLPARFACARFACQM